MDAVDLAVRLIQCVPQDSRDAFGKDLRAFESAVRQQALEEAARILGRLSRHTAEAPTRKKGAR